MNDSTSNSNPVSTSAPAAFPPFFRRRTLGRAPSPPTWACYEQIPPPASSDSDECEDEVQTDSDTPSGSDSEAEDEPERLPRSVSPGGDMEMEMQVGEPEPSAMNGAGMDVDGAGIGDRDQDGPGAEHACGSAGEQCNDDECDQRLKRQDKGKQRAVEPEPELETMSVEKNPKKRHRKRKHHEASFVYRPILTIKKSEGFVWNQDLFVPSYIKDRYIASTSPPSSGFTTNTPSSSVPASEFNNSYEVEVVEIRVQGNELDGIIP